jgi:homeobox protein Nkx-1
MRAGLSLTSQERRPVLLVRTGAESFPRYDSTRQQQQQQQQQHQHQQQQQQQQSPSSSPILRSVSIVEKDQYRELDTQIREKRPNDEEEEDQDEEEEDEVEDERNAPPAGRNVVVDEEDDEEPEEEEEEEGQSERHRNGSYHREDGDVEVDVCREDADESNPSSPVDLTAPSSRVVASEQFVHPFANRGVHPFTCVQSGGPVGHGTPVYITGHAGATGSTVMTVCTSGGVTRTTTGTSTGSITTTATSTVQTNNKRCLAFSVENILDPNKFTGGRLVHRVHHRRHRRAGSVHEGE